ncbi:MAG: universal stress protein UspA [Marinosulfonomonas sp.]|nr:MAG: universal stress protein UspA [Marinosulfonomonas sp.]
MIKSILLPVDLNHESSWDKALPQAVSLAQANGAELHVLTVIPNYGSSMVGSYFPEDFAENALKETKEALDTLVAANIPNSVKATAHAVHGTIYKRILVTADDNGCDLIVLGSTRPSMQDYLLGPNAARVVRHAKQSVFVVRGE